MKNKIKKNHLFSNYLLTLILLFCFILQLSVQGVVYVNKNAPGPTHDGNSWADAYTTIQAGINDADINNESVWVAQGTYLESIIMKSGVKLYGGFNGTETSRSQRNWTTNITTIDGSTARGGLPAYHTVTMDSITSCTIDGFNITGGNANGPTEIDTGGGGICCANLNNTNSVVNNIISVNSAIYGGGIVCYYSSITITNNKISGNSAIEDGGGILCYHSYSIIKNNTISGNAANSDGGGIGCSQSSPTIINNIISGNSTQYGGGIYCDMNSSPIIQNNTILENSSIYLGGGIYCCEDSSLSIMNNTISLNSANNNGGGIYCDYSSPTISSNNICGNSSFRAGGIYCDSNSSPNIMNNIIAGNLANKNGGGMKCYESSPTIINNTVAYNFAGLYAGGIYCELSSPTIKNTIFYNNNKYDILEDDTSSDPLVSYNDFYGNTDGVYYDEGTTPYTSVSAMDSAIPECSNNIGPNPLFVGGTLSGGTWTATPIYSSNSFQTTLTNSSASWIINKHAGRLLNPDTTQNKQFVIVSNTSTTINVWGDVTSIAHTGDAYQIFDYHLRSDSPCIDAGCLISGLTEDFEGDPRPINGTIQVRGDGSDYDIGADEYNRSVDVDNWILYE